MSKAERFYFRAVIEDAGGGAFVSVAGLAVGCLSRIWYMLEPD